MRRLGELYKNTLTAMIGHQALVYDYDDNLDELWGDNNGQPTVLKQLEEQKKFRIVIVWDGCSDKFSNRNNAGDLLRRHVTPLDWALAFSIKLLRVLAEQETLLRGIHIVDLTGSKHDNWAMNMRHTLLAEMPWVTLHAPLIPQGYSRYRSGYQDIVGGIWREIIVRNERLTAACKDHLQLLARQWAATLTHSHDHHDVNNIIGADLLAGDGNRRDGYTFAILSKLRWFGYGIGFDRAYSWPATNAVGSFLFDRPLSIWVIDDQIKQGWGRFLCCLVEQDYDRSALDNEEPESIPKQINSNKDNNQKVKIFGSRTPDCLFDFLEKRSILNKRNFCSQVTDSDKTVPEIIFLDLRLYFEKDTARKQGSRLIQVARTKMLVPLAWEPISEEELNRISAWCSGEDDGRERTPDEALLLLPRLLALALPLTPIILFSSTGQSWIRECLKPYQNIITSFEKPRVLSNPEAVETSIAALRNGLGQSVKMLRLRLQLAHAQRTCEMVAKHRPESDAVLIDQHIEIYADETRSLDEGITSGLAFCVFPDKRSADQLQDALNTQHSTSNGIVWARNTNIANKHQTRLSKGSDISRDPDQCQRQAEDVANLLSKADLGPENRKHWSVIATRVQPEDPNKHSDASLAAFPDGPLDAALRFNLEFALYVLIPYFMAEDLSEFKGSISIHLPTRLVPLTDQRVARDLALAFDMPTPEEGFNINLGRRVWMLQTSSKIGNLGTGFPLIRGWLHDWRMFVCMPPSRISSIQTTVLGRGTNNGITPGEATQRRLFHDVADWACTASGKWQRFDDKQWVWPLREALAKNKVFNRWFTGTDGTRRPPLGKYNFEHDSSDAMVLMTSLREGFSNDSVQERGSDSIRLMLRNSNINNCSDRLLSIEYCAPQRMILWSLRHDLDFADGRALHSLLIEAVDTAKQEESQTTSSLAPSTPTRESAEGKAMPVVDPSELQREFRRQSSDRQDRLLPTSDTTSYVEPEVLSGEDLQLRHPEGKEYRVVMAPTRSGEILLNEPHLNSMRASFRAHSRAIALQLGGKGWAEPKTIWGIRLSNEATGTSPIKVIAGLLENRKWRIFM